MESTMAMMPPPLSTWEVFETLTAVPRVYADDQLEGGVLLIYPVRCRPGDEIEVTPEGAFYYPKRMRDRAYELCGFPSTW